LIRLFNVYFPIRMLVLLIGDALIVAFSFVLGTMLQNREDSGLLLNVEYGYLKIFAFTGVVLLLSHWFDLYDYSHLGAKWDQIFRLLQVLGFVALALSAARFFYPSIWPGNISALPGLIILTFTLFGWRAAYTWMVKQPFLRERVYVLGTGERAHRLVKGLRERAALGIEVVSWTGNLEGEVTLEAVAAHLREVVHKQKVHRVILAMSDRRGTIPMWELFGLRLAGLKVEEATSWLEKISGRIEVENLYPGWVVLGEGFRFSLFFQLMQRLLDFTLALALLIFTLSLLPFIVVAVKLDSQGPVLYRQKRVGRRGATFYCYKFRTMRQHAEAENGPQWAVDNDPRVTRVGKFLRSSRLDDIPQLWCVLIGEMALVGPRPERPELVELLSKEIPFYGVRHIVRPGITGWAQINYKHVNTVEDAREELQYDLFYIKKASIGLDLLVMFQTIKMVLLLRAEQ